MTLAVPYNYLVFVFVALILFKLEQKFKWVNYSQGRFYIKNLGLAGARSWIDAAIVVVLNTAALVWFSDLIQNFIVSQAFLFQNIQLTFIVFAFITVAIFTGWKPKK